MLRCFGVAREVPAPPTSTMATIRKSQKSASVSFLGTTGNYQAECQAAYLETVTLEGKSIDSAVQFCIVMYR